MLVALLLVAHFLRAGNFVAMIVCVAAPLLLLIRNPWVLIAGQVLLTAAGLLWIHILIDLVRLRLALGEPWLRLAIILSGVAALSIAAAFIFRTTAFKKRYGAVTKPEA